MTSASILQFKIHLDMETLVRVRMKKMKIVRSSGLLHKHKRLHTYMSASTVFARHNLLVRLKDNHYNSRDFSSPSGHWL